MSCVLYGILYPWEKGCIREIAESGKPVTVPLVGLSKNDLTGTWMQYLHVGALVDPEGREQYMGEIHFDNAFFSEDDLPKVLKQLNDWMETAGLVKIGCCDVEGPPAGRL